jgi:hypothetical protein
VDEARRFLRYIIPGAIFAFLTALWLYIVLLDWPSFKLLEFTDKEGIGGAIAALLASGALGYIFATVHHCLHWNCPKYNQKVLDHSDMVNKLLKTQSLLGRVDV